MGQLYCMDCTLPCKKEYATAHMQVTGRMTAAAVLQMSYTDVKNAVCRYKRSDLNHDLEHGGLSVPCVQVVLGAEARLQTELQAQNCKPARPLPMWQAVE